MKIERLIGIIILLLQRKKVTAGELAQRFCVSKRTIYRDVDDICLAGIPIRTYTGTDGGIVIDENYKIDKTLFTEKELRAVLTGLLSLDSVSSDDKYQSIMEKFLSENQSFTRNHFLINLSSHYKDSLAPKIELLQQALEQYQLIAFDYYNQKGSRQVVMEPYFIVFQWSSWYVFGCAGEKKEFRLYKLNRLWNIQILAETFEPREIPGKELEFDGYFTDEIQAVILFEQSERYKLIEEYGLDCYRELENGKLEFRFPFTNQEYLLQWVMSFGAQAELIEPIELREELKIRIQSAVEKYS